MFGMTRLWMCGCSAAALLIFLSACGKQEALKTLNTPASDETPTVGDMLVCQMGAEPHTLNPIISSDAYEGMINGKIYEPMINRDKKTFEWIPWLATSWEISPDKMVYTFKLRQD